MSLPLKFPYPPMEAATADEIPDQGPWQYEPKWDGFRCLTFRDGETVRLQSKAGKPLERFFPEVVEEVRAVKATKFVLDGEIVVPVGGRLSFDDLLMRVHPAESRVRALAKSHPARLVVFDLLVDQRGTDLTDLPLSQRRPRLDAFARRFLKGTRTIRLSPSSTRVATAREWLKGGKGDLDGVMAKDRDREYRSGRRDGMIKVKRHRTADCVVGGFRYATAGKIVGSLLLGLYDTKGLLHHVGFTSSLSAADRKKLTPHLEKLIQPPGFTGGAPGGPSRWGNQRSADWQPLKPKLVVEVKFDHVTSGRFRHGTRFLRWRPDKAPRQCTLEQLGRGTRAHQSAEQRRLAETGV